jgi:8-oxo-dGTP pyrophosphatase MutT (NUDIX family)
MEVRAPRDAATVIVARDVAGGIEVYMLRRSAKSKAFPDVYVFPGGTVDPDDHSPEARSRLVGRLSLDEPAVIHAAIRETFEECGLLFSDTPVPAERLRAARLEMLAGKMSFRQILVELDVCLDAGALHYFSRRITPPEHPIRFDARFFVASLPAGQVAEADAFETHDGRWVEPSAMLASVERKDVQMLRPTIKNLERAGTFPNVAALLSLQT